MSIKPDFLLKALHVLSWIIFVGVCIDAGGVLVHTILTSFINPARANIFWVGLDLSHVYAFNEVSYVTLTTLMSIVTILKAILFYIIIKIFHDKKLKLSQPFTMDFGRYISTIAYISLGIGLFSLWGSDLVSWLSEQHVMVPPIHKMKIGGADVWLFVFFILIIFAKIFKRGVEIQSENDLTV